MVTCQACGAEDRCERAWARGPAKVVEIGYYCSPCYAAAVDRGIAPETWTERDLAAAFRLHVNTRQGTDGIAQLDQFVRLASGGIEPCIDCGAFVDVDDGACRTCSAMEQEEMRRDLRGERMHG